MTAFRRDSIQISRCLLTGLPCQRRALRPADAKLLDVRREGTTGWMLGGKHGGLPGNFFGRWIVSNGQNQTAAQASCLCCSTGNLFPYYFGGKILVLLIF